MRQPSSVLFTHLPSVQVCLNPEINKFKKKTHLSSFCRLPSPTFPPNFRITNLGKAQIPFSKDLYNFFPVPQKASPFISSSHRHGLKSYHFDCLHTFPSCNCIKSSFYIFLRLSFFFNVKTRGNLLVRLYSTPHFAFEEHFSICEESLPPIRRLPGSMCQVCN